MKFKTTKKAMRDASIKIVKVGYCDAQHILKFKDAVAYSSGINGWECDYYDLQNGIWICSGYNPIGVANDIIAKYEQMAVYTINYGYDYDTMKTIINDLYESMIGELENDLYK
jgi:hypothetical protein